MPRTNGEASSSAARFLCAACGHHSPSWFGRCPSCGQWSSAGPPDAGRQVAEVVTLGTAASEAPRLPTGMEEIDRVLGGGIVAGTVLLLAGEPGIGKSTLVLQLMDRLAAHGSGCLLVTGEESVSQVALRASRLGLSLDGMRVASSTSLESVIAACERTPPEVLVLDSIQTLEDTRLDQSAGSVAQVRECAGSLVRHAKATGIAVVLVGHVTKDGAVAGPKTLEHVVDGVLTLEGERGGALRTLHAVKNRFGSCEETGVFTMTERGLEGVEDPSALLLADRRAGASGSVVFPSLEGSRPVLVELQALACRSSLAQPRRVALGLDLRRLSMLLAVLDQHAGTPVVAQDVFVAAAGGLRVREPAADLALCLALFSAHFGVALSPHVTAIGEVGLAGEIRRAPGLDRRLAEASRLGFSRAIVPSQTGGERAGIELAHSPHLAHALASARAA